MIKRIISFYIIFYFSLALSLSAQNFQDIVQNNYKIDLLVSNRLTMKGKGRLSNLIARYYFLPKDDRRQNLDFIDYFSRPHADSVVTKDGKFIWHELHDEYELGYFSIITTSFFQYPIIHSKYPTASVPDSLKPYLNFDWLIRNNTQIKTLTESLTEGEDELFDIAFNIGNWINGNIKYVKTGVEKVEPATHTLKLKYGDCDEIAILYIAMLRSAGVASRYVTGIALGNNGFDFHAWTEIYFENIGWVPFDATFSQYGYLDQSHVKLIQSASNPIMLTNYYEFYPHFGDINIESKFPELSVVIRDSTPHNIHPFDMEVLACKNIVGVDSYFPVILKTKNKSPYFVSNRIFVRDMENIEIIGKQENCLSYAPYEEKRLEFMLKLGDVEKEDTQYNSSFIVFDQFGSADTVSLSFVPFGKRISEEKAQILLDHLGVDLRK